MNILDSNIIIYSFQSQYSFLKPLVIDPGNGFSSISRLEILGFHAIQPNEQVYCEYVFQILQEFPIDNTVLNEAVLLRRSYKMKSVDSIVAATALLYQADLYTRNVDDFKDITGLNVINPIP